MKSRSLLLVVMLFVAAVSRAEGHRIPLEAADDGTVTGTLTVNGEKFTLKHAYGRKREAWPADAKLLGVDSVDDLSCGIVELLFTNVQLTENTITDILRDEYKGSEKIRGLRIVIDGAGKHDFEKLFLLESGAVAGYGITQTSGEIEGGRHFTGHLTTKNEEVTQVRVADVTFDTAVKVRYTPTEMDDSERIPDDAIADAFLKNLPGEWTIERWVGLGCTTADGTLVVDERVSPRAFHATFHITLSTGEELEEEATLSLVDNRVHVEGGRVSVPETVWRKDVIDLLLWKDLMFGNTDTDYVALRKVR